MSYFTKSNSRLLAIVLVAVMLMTLCTGCFGSKDPDPTDDTQSNVPPGLVDVKPTEAETEPTEATEPKNSAVVTGDQVAVRSSPSTTSKPIGYLDKGTVVEILRTNVSLGVKWALTDTGWVAAEYLDFNYNPVFEGETTPEETEPTENTDQPSTTSFKGVISASPNLNIRKEPTTDSERVGSYDRGTVVTIEEVKNGWGRTNKGWINMEHVETDGNYTSPEGTGNTNTNTENNNNTNTNTNNANIKAVVTATELNIRKEANTGSDRVGGYVYGDRITILETSNGWGRTNKGWIHLDYVYRDGDTGEKTAKGIVSGTQLNVRGGPGTNYDKVDSLTYGKRVYILEQITVDGTTWACIEQGWISMDYVYVDGTEGEGAGTGVVIGDGVNIRSGPGTGFQSVGSVNTDDTVKIYAQFEIGDMVWGCTDKGWIAMQFVTMG